MEKDILNDSLAAQKVIPDLGYDWPDAKLRRLGEDVQAKYPELASWQPYLAAEAHLYYTSRHPSDPGQVSVRDVGFLPFLRAAIAGHVDRSSQMLAGKENSI